MLQSAFDASCMLLRVDDIGIGETDKGNHVANNEADLEE